MIKVFLLSMILIGDQDHTDIQKPDTIYTQEIWYEESIFSSAKGEILILTDGVAFCSRNPKKQNYNFNIAYDEIKTIKRVWYFVFPNRILFQTRDGENYRFYTYRRKRIIEAAKMQMANS